MRLFIRELQLYLNPQAEHLLDWFHITMRITVMKQMAKDPEIKTKWREKLLKRIESIKWYLWHGNVFEALQEIESLEELCYGVRSCFFVPDSVMPNYHLWASW